MMNIYARPGAVINKNVEPGWNKNNLSLRSNNGSSLKFSYQWTPNKCQRAQQPKHYGNNKDKYARM